MHSDLYIAWFIRYERKDKRGREVTSGAMGRQGDRHIISSVIRYEIPLWIRCIPRYETAMHSRYETAMKTLCVAMRYYV